MDSKKLFIYLSACLAVCAMAAPEVRAVDNAEVAEGEVAEAITITAAPLPKYRVETNDSGVLVDMPAEKVPITVDTLTSDFIRERNVTDLDQLLSLQPGIYQGGKTMMQRQAGTYQIRGFSRSEVFMGGVPLSGGAAIYMDPSLLERVDIIKGPTGAAYGAQNANGSSTDMGGSGGMIILTPKMATFERDITDLSIRGSYSRATGSRMKFMSDINRVYETERVAVRVPLAYEWRDPGWAADGSRHGTMYTIAPSFSYRLTDRLTLGLDLMYQYSDQPAYQGVRTYYGKPVKYLADGRRVSADWDDTSTEAGDRMKFRTFGATFRADGQLTDWIRTRTRVSYFQTQTKYKYQGPYSNIYYGNKKDFMNGELKRYEWAAGDRISRNLYLGQDFIFDFETGPVEHQFLVGANLYNRRNNGRGSFQSTGPVDLEKLDATDESQIKMGLQAQDVMSWKGFSLLTGVRADWHDSVNHAHAWTYSPRLGFSYDILEEGIVILYANASITENPNFNYKATPNEKGDNYLDTTWRAVQKELGLRVNPVGSLWAQVACFWIDQSNAPILMAGTNADDGYYSSDGKTSSKGVEFSLSGDLTENWSMYAAYAYSHYLDRNSGKHFDRYPPHAISLWTSYKAPWFYDAVFGFGARWRDGWLMTFRGSEAGPDQIAKDLLTFDASVDFPLSETLSLGFSLRNIFDTRGIESARNLQAFANDGRTFELSLRWSY